MGMFNTIVADVPCPETGETSRDTEIQIKWQSREARVLDVYRAGDALPDLLSGYDNTWVRMGGDLRAVPGAVVAPGPTWRCLPW